MHEGHKPVHCARKRGKLPGGTVLANEAGSPAAMAHARFSGRASSFPIAGAAAQSASQIVTLLGMSKNASSRARLPTSSGAQRRGQEEHRRVATSRGRGVAPEVGSYTTRVGVTQKRELACVEGGA